MSDVGQSWDSLKEEMIRRGHDDAKWREGKTAVYVFIICLKCVVFTQTFYNFFIYLYVVAD